MKSSHRMIKASFFIAFLGLQSLNTQRSTHCKKKNKIEQKTLFSVAGSTASASWSRRTAPPALSAPASAGIAEEGLSAPLAMAPASSATAPSY